MVMWNALYKVPGRRSYHFIDW